MRPNTAILALVVVGLTALVLFTGPAGPKLFGGKERYPQHEGEAQDILAGSHGPVTPNMPALDPATEWLIGLGIAGSFVSFKHLSDWIARRRTAKFRAYMENQFKDQQRF